MNQGSILGLFIEENQKPKISCYHPFNVNWEYAGWNCQCPETTVYGMELCFFTGYPELHQSSNRYAWHMLAKYAEWTICIVRKRRMRLFIYREYLEWAVLTCWICKSTLHLTILGNWKRTLKIFRWLFRSSGGVLWDKQVETNKPHASVPFKGAIRNKGASVNRFSLKDLFAGTLKKFIQQTSFNLHKII